ncbi:hypothetical protein JD844_012829 [Phrynosoma platyrhinos]|uniref:Uncharacterized protein n=1 Tax=Phrynosoma platyrhinos TaxID=52577 RepID=A0ABQ7TKE9_PHRPL|nr:hypothetical protein JD844_012829 [Phrynosoma platyrhinos]
MHCASNTGPDRGSILYSRSKNYVNIFIDLRAKKLHLLEKILSGFFVAKIFQRMICITLHAGLLDFKNEIQLSE